MRWLRKILRSPGRARGGRVQRYADGDLITVQLSPARSTTRRPGETWAEATNRLTEGVDLD